MRVKVLLTPRSALRHPPARSRSLGRGESKGAGGERLRTSLCTLLHRGERSPGPGCRQGLPAHCPPRSGDAARRGRREKKAPKCQQQMKGVGKFNLPTFSTNVTFGFPPDKLSAPEVSFFYLFSFLFFFSFFSPLAGNLKINGLERSLNSTFGKD